MLAILGTTVPIYVAILLGYLSVSMGLFSRADMRVFGKFVVNLALPAMLFNALSQRKVTEVLNTTYLVAYAAGSLATLALGLYWARRVAGHSRVASVFQAMGMGCSNSGFVGYPIMLLTLAPVAGVSLALNMLVENLLLIPLLLALAERGSGQGGAFGALLWQSLRRLASNPIFIGLGLGLLASVLSWQPPGPLARTINLFAMASGALALFSIGGTLVGLQIKGLASRVMPVVVGKLVVHPLLVALTVLALPWLGLPGLDPALQMAVILTGAMPMMGIYAVLAQPYGQDEISAATTLAATVASFFSISAVLWLLQHLLGSQPY